MRLASPVRTFSAHRITSYFGTRNDPRTGGQETHEGIDIKAEPAEEIIASAAGTVAYSGRERGFGNVVIIDHGSGVSTVYAHLFYTRVRKGERVGAGEIIGRAGKRGSATGTHLHFEIRRDGRPVDPMLYLWLDSRAR